MIIAMIIIIYHYCYSYHYCFSFIQCWFVNWPLLMFASHCIFVMVAGVCIAVHSMWLLHCWSTSIQCYVIKHCDGHCYYHHHCNYYTSLMSLRLLLFALLLLCSGFRQIILLLTCSIHQSVWYFPISFYTVEQLPLLLGVLPTAASISVYSLTGVTSGNPGLPFFPVVLMSSSMASHLPISTSSVLGYPSPLSLLLSVSSLVQVSPTQVSLSLSLSSEPFSARLVHRIRSGQLVEMQDLPGDNISQNQYFNL